MPLLRDSGQKSRLGMPPTNRWIACNASYDSHMSKSDQSLFDPIDVELGRYYSCPSNYLPTATPATSLKTASRLSCCGHHTDRSPRALSIEELIRQITIMMLRARRQFLFCSC